jgi:hypothetical protein
MAETDRDTAKQMSPRTKTYNYDICLSFAGEDRKYVRELAGLLLGRGIRVFYDEYEKAQLWGKDLYSHLDDIYRNAARYCVVFLSKHYAKKLWTNHERQSAQARAVKENVDYLLPARFDDTKIPGIRETLGYIDLRSTTPAELADIITAKIGPRSRTNYFQPVPDRLFKALKAKTKSSRQEIGDSALIFFRDLKRMSAPERRLIYNIFANCCPAQLPKNVHIDLDLLRRITRVPIPRIVRMTEKLGVLGFDSKVRLGHGKKPTKQDRNPVLVLEWHNRSVALEGDSNHTRIANEILQLATDGLCEGCGREALRKLDFAQLATATITVDEH